MRRSFKVITVFVLVLALLVPAAFGGSYAAGAGAGIAESRIGAQKSFTDVKAGAWYEGTVTEMTGRGLLSGYPDGTFRPNAAITAAEFVAVVTRCAGLEDASPQSSHWAAGQLAAALDAGWNDWDEIPPTGEKHNLPISRQLAVKILMKALLPNEHGDYAQQAPKIRDLSNLDGRYYDAVFAAYAAGITEGDNTGSFHAKDGLSRAEACAIIERALQKSGKAAESGSNSEELKPISGGVSENGRLSVKGTSLCNERGEKIVLRGMSSHGIHWYPQFASKQAIANTAEHGANLFRVAMYTGEGGYISRPDAVKKQALDAVDAAIANDMYVIIDWHILSDGNPAAYKEQAKTFFDEVSKVYADEPAVIYEICNEPNGNVSWERDIKPYAEEMIKVIRKNAPDAVILIGSGTWSQDIHTAAANPVSGKNLMYTCHFYAGTHGKWLRDRIDAALASGLPVFISEWGTSAADGSGGTFLKEAKEWTDFMDSRGLSWANWSLCDKGETSAALKTGTSPNAKWAESDLTESGKFVFSQF